MTTDHTAQPLHLDVLRARSADTARYLQRVEMEHGPIPVHVRLFLGSDIPALLAEVERLRGLVGDENQPGWEGCSRAEAIRQAESFHASVMEWKRAHDERRAERDEARAEVERMRPIVLAAIAWRETEALPVHALDDQELALIAAVDEIGEVAW